MKVIDDFLSTELSDFLENYYLYDLPHWFGHRSTEDPKAKPVYHHPLQPDALHNFIFYKIKKIVDKDLEMLRAYINVQHENMKGSRLFHKDDGTHTFIYMASQTLEKGIGCLEFDDGEKIDFVKNRLVCFDAQRMHKGNEPNTYMPRITLVFKTTVKYNE